MISFLRWLQFPVHEWETTSEFHRGVHWSGWIGDRKCIHCGRVEHKVQDFKWSHVSGPLRCTIEQPAPRHIS